MAYVNGVQMLRDIGARAAELGGNVIFEPGWENRGNGQSWPARGPKGFINHHTAGGRNIYLDRNLVTGVPGLTGPLCNFAILYDGDICLVSAGPANHAGASGGWDTAPLPVTGWFNREVLGVEIQYPGTEPMADVQYEAMIILNRAAMDVMGWPEPIVLKNHEGTSTQGKWDPGYAWGKTYDINETRRKVAEMKGKDGFLMSLNEGEQKEVLTGARQLGQAWPTRNGEKWVAEMVSAIYNEVVYGGFESLYDTREGVPEGERFTGSPVRYLLEIDAKMEGIARAVAKIAEHVGLDVDDSDGSDGDEEEGQ